MSVGTAVLGTAVSEGGAVSGAAVDMWSSFVRKLQAKTRQTNVLKAVIIKLTRTNKIKGLQCQKPLNSFV